MTEQEKKQKAIISKNIREREIARLEKIYKEAQNALPMALDENFCRRIMNESQSKQADLRKQIEELKKIEVEK